MPLEGETVSLLDDLDVPNAGGFNPDISFAEDLLQLKWRGLVTDFLFKRRFLPATPNPAAGQSSELV